MHIILSLVILCIVQKINIFSLKLNTNFNHSSPRKFEQKKETQKPIEKYI